MQKVGIVKDNIFLNHCAPYEHPENPERLLAIHQMLSYDKNLKDLIPIQLKKASKEEIELVHTPSYVDLIEDTSKRDFSVLDGDTYASKATFETALLAAGSTVSVVEKVFKGELNSAFSFVRPPGHHSEKDKAMGFCIFNNIAIAAKYALQNLGAKKIAIIDFDLHHGNGTQNAFYDTDQVLYISIHQFPYYPGTGSIAEIGIDKGEGFNINIPFPAGYGDPEYMKVTREIIKPVVLKYKPDILLLSAGFHRN